MGGFTELSTTQNVVGVSVGVKIFSGLLDVLNGHFRPSASNMIFINLLGPLLSASSRSMVASTVISQLTIAICHLHPIPLTCIQGPCCPEASDRGPNVVTQIAHLYKLRPMAVPPGLFGPV